MPYLGNVIQLGNHSGNFKVLDDIKTHTATFDGSASSVVSTSNDTIRIAKHRFIQGQRVTYTNGGGGDIGGLTNNTAYFIIFDSNETFKLATSASNAANSTAINLSAVGSGTSHTLNVAFDGTNTKFKATTGGGSIVKVSDPVQLNIAINNVVQKPNPKSAVLSEGFTIEDSHKIVFATAPSSNEVFWGSLIAKTVQTFDISDNKIDNFTGDGSTTEFTLSRIPPNSNSILVTLDGVTQHPTDASGTRSYSLDGNNLEFTAAPGNGVEIQVRHIGFAGASSASVTGFYGRTGNVTLRSSDNITTGDITSRNINASGIITASSFIGDGSDLTNLPAGLGTALSSTQSSPLNKMYFTDQVLGIGATLTVNAPASSNTAYTQYQDIKVESNADLIVADGDDFIPDVLGLNNFATLGGGTGGRIRIDRITNQSANGAVFIENGVVVSGIATLPTLNNQNLSGITTVQDLNVAGVSTFSSDVSIADKIVHTGDTNTAIRFPAADIISFECAGEEILKIGKSSTELLRISGPVDSSTQQEFGIGIAVNDAHTHPAAQITLKEYDASDSRGDLLFYTRGANSDSAPDERIRITSDGNVGINSTTPRTYLQVSKGSSHYNPGNPTAFNSVNVLACFENNDDVEVTLLSPNNKKNIINFGDTDNVANSSIEYDHSINHLLFKVNGGSERLRINNSGAFGLAGTNYGTNTSTYNSQTGKSSQALVSNGGSAAPTWGYTNRPAFMAQKSSSQTITTGTWTKVQLDEEILDTDNAYDNTTNHRFTVPTGGAGWYMCHFSTGIDDVQDSDYVYSRLYLNGSGINHAIGSGWCSAANAIVQATTSHMLHLDDGDYLELYVYHNEGSNEPVEQNRCRFSAFRLNI